MARARETIWQSGLLVWHGSALAVVSAHHRDIQGQREGWAGMVRREFGNGWGAGLQASLRLPDPGFGKEQGGG